MVELVALLYRAVEDLETTGTVVLGVVTVEVVEFLLADVAEVGVALDLVEVMLVDVVEFLLADVAVEVALDLTGPTGTTDGGLLITLVMVQPVGQAVMVNHPAVVTVVTLLFAVTVVGCAT